MAKNKNTYKLYLILLPKIKMLKYILYTSTFLFNIPKDPRAFNYSQT